MSNLPDKQPSDLKKLWRKPRNVREFAVQMNEVTTMILNDEIPLEKAKVYSGLARGIVQTASSETTRARFVKEEPNLSLELEE